MYNLDLIASEISIFIFENEDLTEQELDIKAEKYIKEKWEHILPCQIAYILDKAKEIYYKM